MAELDKKVEGSVKELRTAGEESKRQLAQLDAFSKKQFQEISANFASTSQGLDARVKKLETEVADLLARLGQAQSNIEALSAKSEEHAASLRKQGDELRTQGERLAAASVEAQAAKSISEGNGKELRALRDNLEAAATENMKQVDASRRELSQKITAASAEVNDVRLRVARVEEATMDLIARMRSVLQYSREAIGRQREAMDQSMKSYGETIESFDTLFADLDKKTEAAPQPPTQP